MRKGWLEVVAGCMYSGKTGEMIRRLRRAKVARQHVILIKPSIDNRYSEDNVSTHDRTEMKAVQVAPSPFDLLDIWEKHDKPEVIGIDEGQFFGPMGTQVMSLVEEGVRVIISGLDLDYRGEPFLDPTLFSYAERVDKLTAICTVCTMPATHTFRTNSSHDRVLVGSKGLYEARCRDHWSPGESG